MYFNKKILKTRNFGGAQKIGGMALERLPWLRFWTHICKCFLKCYMLCSDTVGCASELQSLFWLKGLY